MILCASLRNIRIPKKAWLARWKRISSLSFEVRLVWTFGALLDHYLFPFPFTPIDHLYQSDFYLRISVQAPIEAKQLFLFSHR